MAAAPRQEHHLGMHPAHEDAHRPLCTIELTAEGHAGRCPGAACAFWENGCALARIETELNGRPEVAQLLLDLRREIESGRALELDAARSRLSRILAERDDGDAALPGAGEAQDTARGFS